MKQGGSSTMKKLFTSVPLFWLILSDEVFAQTPLNGTGHTFMMYLMSSIPILFYLILIYIFSDYKVLFWRKRAMSLGAQSSGKVTSIKTYRKLSKIKNRISI